MGFGEKLKLLRQKKGLTQEQLAEALYVSRTAVSKWESERGYPSIDSLKEISGFFSVSLDELISGEKIVSIAEDENEKNIKNMGDALIGAADMLFILFIILPLFSKAAEGRVLAVNLFACLEKGSILGALYPVMFTAIIAAGIIKFALSCKKVQKGQRGLTAASMALGILCVLLLTAAREVNAAAVAFILLIIKGAVLLKLKPQKV